MDKLLRSRRPWLLAAAAALALAAAAAAGAASSGTTLDLVAYSTPKPALATIVAAWQRTPDGSGVAVNQSYGPSTNQARAVAAGQPADVLFLSTGDDVNLAVDAGVVDRGWARGPYRGIAADTVVVFALRNGNPKHIRTWADLIRPGVQVVTPNPLSSGSAKWNVLAAYGAQRALGKTDAQATDYVRRLFAHVVAQDTSAANATNTFLAGKGDVLLTYESEAINARLQGRDVQYVIPRQTMLIELPMTVTKTSRNAAKAEQFVRYCTSPPAQRVFAQYGFRPVDPQVAAEPAVRRRFPARPGMFRVDEPAIGGWRRADRVWFDPRSGRMTQIEREVGGPG